MRDAPSAGHFYQWENVYLTVLVRKTKKKFNLRTFLVNVLFTNTVILTDPLPAGHFYHIENVHLTFLVRKTKKNFSLRPFSVKCTFYKYRIYERRITGGPLLSLESCLARFSDLKCYKYY